MRGILVQTETHKQEILSSRRSAYVFFKDFYRGDFKVKDWVTLEFPWGTPIGTYEIAEVRECLAAEISFDEARTAGFVQWTDMIQSLRAQYPGFQVEATPLILDRWEPIVKCEECDERDQT